MATYGILRIPDNYLIRAYGHRKIRDMSVLEARFRTRHSLVVIAVEAVVGKRMERIFQRIAPT